MINDIKQNKYKFQKSLKEINDYELSLISNYKTESGKNGLLFQVYCSNKYNIPMYKYSTPELIGLHHGDVGIDLLDIENKITGQCKCVANQLSFNKASSYIKCVEFINSQFQGWKHYLYTLDVTKIEGPTMKALNDNNIIIVREPFETKYSLKVKEENDRINNIIQSKLQSIFIFKENGIYVTPKNIRLFSSEHDVKISYIENILYAQGFKSSHEHTDTKYGFGGCWFKENEEIISNKSLFEKELIKIIKPYGIFDKIDKKELQKLCEKIKTIPSASIVCKTLRNLNFMPAYEHTRNIKAWLRYNNHYTELNEYIQKHINDYVKVSVEKNINYIIPNEIKDYCVNNNLIYDSVVVIKRIKELGFIINPSLWLNGRKVYAYVKKIVNYNERKNV